MEAGSNLQKMRVRVKGGWGYGCGLLTLWGWELPIGGLAVGGLLAIRRHLGGLAIGTLGWRLAIRGPSRRAIVGARGWGLVARLRGWSLVARLGSTKRCIGLVA